MPLPRPAAPLRLVLSLLLPSLCSAATGAATLSRPNVVVILADDLGWSDLGCFGGEIPTPNLDALAASGLRFTQFHNTARCCPTRASLLTGLYPHEAGVGHMNNPRPSEGYAGNLLARTPTLPEMLKSAGYRSYMTGKWHLASDLRAAGPKHTWPVARGFDRFYGTLTGAGNFFDPGTLVRDATMISPFADREYPSNPKTYYYTDAISDHAVRYVREHVRDHPGSPFFLYVAHTAPHFPIQAPEEAVRRHRGRYDAGYEAVRRSRLERQRRLGLVDPATELRPLETPWPDDPAERAWFARAMEVYAAQVELMDAGIGRLMESLRETGRWENTLIFFLNDNGASAENIGRAASDAPPPGPRAIDWISEDTRPLYTRDGRAIRYRRDGLPGADDTYMTYGAGWAQVSNTPWRDYKVRQYEGGTSANLIAHWPAGIAPARRGGLAPDVGHLIDLAATVLDAAGTTAPREWRGRAAPALAGLSLRPVFAGGALDPARTVYFEHNGHRAVRRGDWKLVAAEPGGAWELFNLRVDRLETRNLSAAEPEIAARLRADWEDWARRSGVLPWPWTPAYPAAP
jgi:arylsulfatase A-like enzyme